MSTFEESFCEAEEKAMHFLVAEYGFKAVERAVTPKGSNWMGGSVRYQAQAAGYGRPPTGWTVELSFAPGRLELSIELSDGSNNRFLLEELHALASEEPFPRGTYSLSESTHDPELLFAEFSRLGNILRKSGTRFFAGDASVWSALRTRRERAWEADEDRRAVLASERAFKGQNWPKVVSLLEPREVRLSKASAARLAIARGRTKGAA